MDPSMYLWQWVTTDFLHRCMCVCLEDYCTVLYCTVLLCSVFSLTGWYSGIWFLLCSLPSGMAARPLWAELAADNSVLCGTQARLVFLLCFVTSLTYFSAEFWLYGRFNKLFGKERIWIWQSQTPCKCSILGNVPKSFVLVLFHVYLL